MERQLANFAAGHPMLWMVVRVAWWLVRRWTVTLGFALAFWLTAIGLWLPLAMLLGAAVPVAWSVRRFFKVLVPPPGELTFKQSLMRGLNLKDLRETWKRYKLLERIWPEVAMNAGLTGKRDRERIPGLTGLRRTETGMQGTVQCGAVGIPADKVAKSADVLAASVPGCRSVTVVPGITPGYAKLNFQWTDPLAKRIPLEALPLPPYDRISFGVTETGDAATIAKYKSALVVGQSGSGKSGTLWALLASAIADGVPFRLRVVDPAGGVELHALKGSPLVLQYADRPEAAAKLIENARDDMNKRLESMSGSTRMHKPTNDEPWEIIVIDELLLMEDLLKKGVHSPLGQILAIGRKTAFTIWALTQIPQIDTIGRVRNLFVQKLVLKTDNMAMTDAVLGPGSEGNGARASTIPESQPGIGYAAIEGIPGYPRFRSVWVSDAAIRKIVQGKLPVGVRVRGYSSVGADDLENAHHVLYGWYNSEGDLLYVGISNDGQRRAGEHLADKEWSREPGVTMHVMAEFYSRSEALAAEEAAIKDLKPRYNKIHNT